MVSLAIPFTEDGLGGLALDGEAAVAIGVEVIVRSVLRFIPFPPVEPKPFGQFAEGREEGIREVIRKMQEAGYPPEEIGRIIEK